MSKKLKGIAIASITIFSGIGVVTASLAWFLDMVTYSFEQVNLQANSGGAYFAYGSGTDGDPFGIASPRHLYNLAWMQYLGMFEDKQYHFELANDVDMGGYYLPPIGTETYPFLGEFDGQGYAVTGLTVTNSYSDYTGYSKAPEEVTSSNFVAPEIVGFFGVVGKLPTTSTTYTYSSAINTFTNTSLNDIEIKTNGTTTLLAGLAAGYASGELSGIKVGGSSKINVNGQSHTEFTNNLTDYGLVGFTTHEGVRGSYSQDLSEYYNGDPPESEGQDWGGSVTMKEMYQRLYDIAKNSSSKQNNHAYEVNRIRTNGASTTTDENRSTGVAYVYRSQKVGSFVFSPYNDGNAYSRFMYLNGGKKVYPINRTVTNFNTWAISDDGTYLGISNGALSNTPTSWKLLNNKLTSTVNGTTYYLNHNCKLVTSTSDTWIKSGNQLYYETSETILFIPYTQKHYLQYDSGWKTVTNLLGNKDLTFETSITTEASGGSAYMDYSGNEVTYFPLITEDGNYNAARKNTGYVIGGSEAAKVDSDWGRTGDIRVSEYYTTDINNSYSNGNLTHVYTINSSGTRVEITNNHSAYEKYEDSRAGLLDMIADGNIYGLHFMSANINKNHLVTAQYTLINGVQKNNYKMPASSIDFNLKRKGYINFFAGTYFSGNNSFFSLHDIIRDSSDNITDIKEIKEIYKSTDIRKDYIYKYTDNTTSATITSDYSVAFATSQIKKQSSVTTNAVYYFEIPMNAGEYALGSVSGGTGAYLMYLDIGANGDAMDSVQAYYITTKNSTNAYPMGVDFAAVTTGNGGGETFGVLIASGKSGSIIFGVTTGNVNIGGTTNISNYSYKGTKYVDTSPSTGYFNVSGNSPGAMALPPGGGTRVLIINIATVYGFTYVVRITDLLTNESGAYNESSSTYEVDEGSGFRASNKSEVQNLSDQVFLDQFRALPKAATLTRSTGTGAFTTTYDIDNCNYWDKIVDVDVEKNGTTINIGVTSGYTFKIGGVTKVNGSTY